MANILVFSQFWYPENGVPQRRWSWLTKHLTENGHKVFVVAPSVPSKSGRAQTSEHFQRRVVKELGSPSGETIFRSPGISAGQSLVMRTLGQAYVAIGALGTFFIEIFGKQKVDLIIGTVPALPTAMIAASAAKILGVPYVIDLRDAWPDLIENSKSWNKATGRISLREQILGLGPLQIVAWVVRKVLSQVLHSADGIVVTTDAHKRHLIDSLKPRSRGRTRKIVTIRNVFPPLASNCSQPIDCDGNRFTVLYAGTIGRAQNLSNAVYAARILKDMGIDIRLIFVGGGAAKSAVKQLAEELGVEATFEYRRPAEALGDYFSSADTALVHLTDWHPLRLSVPSKTYELMELQIFITGAARGETAELIHQLEAGKIVEPENPMALAMLWRDLINDGNKVQSSSQAREWVQYQRTEVAPKRILGLIEDLVGGK